LPGFTKGRTNSGLPNAKTACTQCWRYVGTWRHKKLKSSKKKKRPFCCNLNNFRLAGSRYRTKTSAFSGPKGTSRKRYASSENILRVAAKTQLVQACRCDGTLVIKIGFHRESRRRQKVTYKLEQGKRDKTGSNSEKAQDAKKRTSSQTELISLAGNSRSFSTLTISFRFEVEGVPQPINLSG